MPHAGCSARVRSSIHATTRYSAIVGFAEFNQLADAVKVHAATIGNVTVTDGGGQPRHVAFTLGSDGRTLTFSCGGDTPPHVFVYQNGKHARTYALNSSLLEEQIKQTIGLVTAWRDGESVAWED